MANADYVIRTDGTFDETNRQVDAVAARLRSSALA
jgi:dephospho-CoA kinase